MEDRDLGGLMQAFEVANVITENSSTRTLLLKGRLESAQPGQFVMVWLPEVGEKPYSIASAVPLALTVSSVGTVSGKLAHLQPGERVWIRGPLGKGFRLMGEKHLLVGGGYGAAPLAFLAKSALKQGGQVKVCLGAKSEADLLMERRLVDMGSQVWVATEDGSKGFQGLVTSLTEQMILEEQPDCVYACGPTGMLVALAEVCKRYQLPAQLSFEGIMRCGVGLCGSCELLEEICKQVGLPSGWLACHDGPVARFDGGR
jgi:dihydroorotate dehydrogenase electron transfer subunit